MTEAENKTKPKATPIKPVKPTKPSFLGNMSPPPITEAADNMKGEDLAPMTFLMPRDWHRRFKATASLRGMSMKELLVLSFQAWEREQNSK